MKEWLEGRKECDICPRNKEERIKGNKDNDVENGKKATTLWGKKNIPPSPLGGFMALNAGST
jgi:hypothetical protein